MKRINRQKKELIKKIEQMETWIEHDIALGCGFAPPGAYDKTYEEIYALREQLAHLSHYKTVEEMYCDTRGQPTDEEILQWAESAQRQKQKRPHKRSKEIGR